MDLKRRLLSQSAGIFAGRIFGAGLIFLVQAAIARMWGATILGDYLLIVAAANIVAVLMPLGFETIGTYFAAEYRARGDGGSLRGFMFRAYGHVVVTTVLLIPLGAFALPLLGEPGRVLATHWVPGCIIAFGMSVMLVNGPLMVGLKRPYAGFFADGVFRPIVIIAALPVAALAATPVLAFSQFIWMIAIGIAVIALIHFAYVVSVVRGIPAAEPTRKGEARRWWRFALPWAVIVLATDFYFDIDLLLLSGLLSREDLAVFGVCTRIFALISFAVTAVYAVIVPDMLESDVASDRVGFQRKMGDANLIAGILSVVMLAGVAVGGPVVLMLFGPDFQVGAGPLLVLVFVLVIRSAFGPAALVLSLNDRPYRALPAVATGIATLVVANLLLVPAMGLMGAAIAAVLAQALWSASMWLIALKSAGLDVSILPRLRELLAVRREAPRAN